MASGRLDCPRAAGGGGWYHRSPGEHAVAASVPVETGRRRRGKVFYGWYIVAASNLTNALLTAAYFQGFQAFVLPILNTFGWSQTQLAGASSLRQLESGIVGPAVGFLSDKAGPRKLIIAGGVIAGLGLIGLSQTRNLAMYYFFFLLISVGTAGATHGVTWPIIISRWFKRRRGLAIGLGTLGPIAGGAMAILNVRMVNSWGWQPVLFVYGCIVAVFVVLMGLIARDRPEPHGYVPDGDEPKRGAAPAAAGGASSSVVVAEQGMTARQVLRSPAFWLVLLFLGGVWVPSSGFGLWQVPYFVTNGMSAATAAATAFVVVAASGLGRVGGSWLVDYVDYRIVLLGVGLCSAFSQFYLLFAHVDQFWLSMPFNVTSGIAMGAMISMRAVIANALFGARSLGSVIGMLQGGSLAAGVAGPLIMGRSYDFTGSYDPAIWFMAFFSLGILPMVWFMKKARRPA
ncbi:MAG: MFS transporter [SAR202 cluster bacterium]|nr:MFS transporter [SAR202 cluster bacterium]